MTEAEWLTSTDPWAMFALVEGRWSRRRARLFTCALGHRFCRIWESAAAENEYYRRVKPGVDAACGAILRAAEDLPDGENQEAVRDLMNRFREEVGGPIGLGNDMRQAIDGNASWWVGIFEAELLPTEEQGTLDASVLREQEEDRRFGANLLRCLCSGPTDPPVADPRWLTETVVALASGIFTERAFDRLPILADALEEAGCDNADILTHCRGDGPHVRGCWVVDLVLGKS